MDRPIVYLRGFAASQDEIDATVATPYMGFNLGSTKVRKSFDGEMIPFVFESPLVRLMKDEGYTDCFMDGAFIPRDGRVSAKSVWIFRYYDKDEEVTAEGKRRDMEEWAADLRVLIERIKRNVCQGDPAAEADFKVHLVAHSMGGLIARAYLQGYCTGKLPGSKLCDPMVDKVFTYGTPHNGIEMQGINVPNLGKLDRMDLGNFNRKRMKEYLCLGAAVEANDLGGSFPPERFFCFVGTNHRDYEAFFGLSKHAVGPMSDGLVLMKNAYVKDSPRAYAHRSHSGPYGLVNSEEGYQNLRRFLFGDVRVDVKLYVDEITLPADLAELKAKAEAKGEDPGIRGKYHISTAARVRNANYQLHERRTLFGSEMLADYDRMTKRDEPVYLFSGFLSASGRAPNAGDRALAFQVELTSDVPLFEVERRFWFDKHFDGNTLFTETATFYVRPNKNSTTVRCRLASATRVTGEGSLIENMLADDKGAATGAEHLNGRGPSRYEIPVGKIVAGKASMRGRLVLETRPWS